MKDLLMFILLISLIVYQISNNKNILKQLKKSQVFGVAVTYIAMIIVATIIIYYGGNWIAGLFPTIILKYLVFGIIVIATFYYLGILVNKVLYKITGRVLPKN